MDLDAGARSRAGRTVLLWWYAAYLAAAVAVVLWYLTGLSAAASDRPCGSGDFWCGGGNGSLVVLLVVVGVPVLAGCLAVSWVLLRVALPRVPSAALAGSLAAVAGPVLLVLLGYGLLHVF
ncbi:hypothetical protein Dvina_32095 [Dactylosporangium vinaceum]|uniref:Integral membrane protein n=1 Tax=Dactylosporangium vinaceum TaxID=53362 RepID=A0ABV5MAM0_9ACTN|nr:hypothetical protein [Dactylosporangium vinaceum]UAB92938.1 hypothetical protein Dvina_32095 [Dactylosporangium vinaceum]